MTEQTNCDGETLFGFTVKACDKPATRRLYNSPHEVYWFCERHHYFAVHGRYPEDEQPRNSKSETQRTDEGRSCS